MWLEFGDGNSSILLADHSLEKKTFDDVIVVQDRCQKFKEQAPMVFKQNLFGRLGQHYLINQFGSSDLRSSFVVIHPSLKKRGFSHSYCFDFKASLFVTQSPVF